MENDDKSNSVSESLVALLSNMQDYQNRDFELRKEEFKRKKIKSRFYMGIFLFFFITYLLDSLGIIKDSVFNGEKYSALIRINGVIMQNTVNSAEILVPAIERACEDDETDSILVKINSPGGSPVQASQIHNALTTCRKETGKKIIVASGDMLTSGAYWIAVAADKIFANESSITGSIGVKREGFGINLSNFLSDYGIERRVQTAGVNKNRGDMFAPLSIKDKEKTKTILHDIHENFKNAVISGRSDRLKGDLEEIFSGDYWTGTTALELGLIDGLKDSSEIQKEILGVKHLLDYTPRASILESFRNTMKVETLIERALNMVNSSTLKYVAM